MLSETCKANKQKALIYQGLFYDRPAFRIDGLFKLVTDNPD